MALAARLGEPAGNAARSRRNGSLPSGSASIHRQCSASAALSTSQASRWR